VEPLRDWVLVEAPVVVVEGVCILKLVGVSVMTTDVDAEGLEPVVASADSAHDSRYCFASFESADTSFSTLRQHGEKLYPSNLP
jgi:hypothetical protein